MRTGGGGGGGNKIFDFVRTYYVNDPIDGTGLNTLRNRCHIRQRYSGTMLTQNTTDDTPTSSTPTHSTSTSDDNSISLTSNPSGQRVAHSDTNQDVSIIIPRRSGRTRRQPLRFRDYEMND